MGCGTQEWFRWFVICSWIWIRRQSQFPCQLLEIYIYARFLFQFNPDNHIQELCGRSNHLCCRSIPSKRVPSCQENYLLGRERGEDGDDFDDDGDEDRGHNKDNDNNNVFPLAKRTIYSAENGVKMMMILMMIVIWLLMMGIIMRMMIIITVIVMRTTTE